MNEPDLLSQSQSGSVVLPFLHISRPPYADWMSFGARLAQARKRAGMTQQELGRGLSTGGEDASKSVVYGWEKDQHYPRVDQLMLICQKLGCSADFLLFGDQSQNVQLAKQAISTLSDEERLALLTAMMQPGLPDEDVARHLPPAPPTPPSDPRKKLGFPLTGDVSRLEKPTVAPRKTNTTRKSG